MKATACTRRLPFGEHRTMAQVIETEQLQRDFELMPEAWRSAKATRLHSLMSRAVMPWLHEPEPPSVA